MRSTCGYPGHAAGRMGATTVEVTAGHVAMISPTNEAAQRIRTAAASVTG